MAGRTGPFPFCICWANEDWTRSWDGATVAVRAAQNHNPDTDFAFIQDAAHLLRHPDYIRVDGRPMLLVYRADKLATPAATAQRCQEKGQEILRESAIAAQAAGGTNELGCRPLRFQCEGSISIRTSGP